MTIYPFRESRDDIRHKIQISKRKSLWCIFFRFFTIW
jgi:hypothetical protein